MLDVRASELLRSRNRQEILRIIIPADYCCSMQLNVEQNTSY